MSAISNFFHRTPEVWNTARSATEIRAELPAIADSLDRAAAVVGKPGAGDFAVFTATSDAAIGLSRLAGEDASSPHVATSRYVSRLMDHMPRTPLHNAVADAHRSVSAIAIAADSALSWGLTNRSPSLVGKADELADHARILRGLCAGA